jgi:hypothetical protein
MQDFYYDEIDELLLEGTDINDVSQEVDKLKKIIATLTIVCGILIGICIAKHVEGNRKYLRGRDQGADDTLRYVNGQIKDQSKFGYVSRNEKGQRQEGLFLFRKDADGNYKLDEDRSRTVVGSKKEFKDRSKKDTKGAMSDKRFYKGHSVDLDLDQIDESYNDYNDFNSTDNSDAFNEILYMIEGTDNRKENLSFLKRIKSALFDRRKQLNTVKKNAKSKDVDVQKQAISDLLKIKSDIKKDKADLTRMAKQIASNNEKIKQLLAGAKL